MYHRCQLAEPQPFNEINQQACDSISYIGMASVRDPVGDSILRIPDERAGTGYIMADMLVNYVPHGVCG